MDDDALFARFAALRAPTHAPESTAPLGLAKDAVDKSARDAADEDAAIRAVAGLGDDDGDLAAILESLGVGKDVDEDLGYVSEQRVGLTRLGSKTRMSRGMLRLLLRRNTSRWMARSGTRCVLRGTSWVTEWVQETSRNYCTYAASDTPSRHPQPGGRPLHSITAFRASRTRRPRKRSLRARWPRRSSRSAVSVEWNTPV